MASHPVELLRDVLVLPPEVRSALIDSLIENLDVIFDEGAKNAWKLETELRLKQIDDGTVELISWNVPRKRLRDWLEPSTPAPFESTPPRSKRLRQPSIGMRIRNEAGGLPVCSWTNWIARSIGSARIRGSVSPTSLWHSPHGPAANSFL